MPGTPNEDKDPRHHELSESKGYVSTGAGDYDYAQNDEDEQGNDSGTDPQFF